SFVTIGMQEYAVVCIISATLASPDDMMAVPSCQFGNFSVAEWTEAALLFPEIEQLPFPFQVLCHFHIETLFKVGLPFGIIWIGCALDFHMSFDGDTCCLEQSNRLERAFLPKDFPMKDPVLPSYGGEVF